MRMREKRQELLAEDVEGLFWGLADMGKF